MASLLNFFRPPSLDEAPLTLAVAGRVVTVVLKRNARARRMTLRMDRKPDTAIMTLPRKGKRKDAQAFAEKSHSWIATQLARQSVAHPIQHGASIPLRGEDHAICATGKVRGLVRHDAAMRELHVPGAAQHVPRRLTDWLKAEALRDLETSCTHYAGVMGVRYSRITIRDQKSRWGSCASSGALSFSWRLVLAPAFVLDYVAAHEVAHLKEMNHGPRFWRLVLTHCAKTREAKTWLKTHGRDLHIIG
jgi:predicted metal-dependent hydrolase